jgi:HEAT repeat protein
MLRPNAQPDSPAADGLQVSEAEIRAVKSVLTALTSAVRTFSLYPCEHGICQKSIRQLKNALSEFFRIKKNLKIDISKNELSYRGTKIYEGSVKNDPILTPLFRDGFLWIEILPEIGLSELELFLKLFGEHRSLKDEAETDLVTALWKAHLSHIRYDAINSFWETPPVFSFSQFRLEQNPRTPRKEFQKKPLAPQAASEPSAQNQIALPGRDNFFELTAVEKKLLEKLIASNAEKDDTQDLIQILTALLADQDTEKDFSFVLELLHQELKLVLENAQFGLGHVLLENVKQLACGSPGPRSWRNPLVHDFFCNASSPGVLESLGAGLAKLKATDANQMSSAQKVMLMLEPKAVEALAGLLSKIHARPLQLLLMSVIQKLSLRDLGPLEGLLNQGDPRLVMRLVTIVAHIKGKRTRELLQRLMTHSSEQVRQRALLWLIKRGELPIENMYALLNDPDPQVRSQLVDYMRRENHPMYEPILRHYLEEKKFRIYDREFLINCYRVLGKCASGESLAFLEKKLFQAIGFPLFGRLSSLHRQGAALALAEAGSQDAQQLLRRASRSFYPPVRRAYKKALEFGAGAK